MVEIKEMLKKSMMVENNFVEDEIAVNVRYMTNN